MRKIAWQITFILKIILTLLFFIHHEPERTGSLKIRKVWLLGSDVMGLQVRRHRT